MFFATLFNISCIEPSNRQKPTYFKSVWIKIQPDATICRYLFTIKLLYMLRVSQHPSSGVLKTVTAASGTGHNIGTATSLQRGSIGPCWREVSVPILWPVPEAAVTVFSTPDDGCCETRNMLNSFAVNNYLHTVASGWIFILIELRCTEPRAYKYFKPLCTELLVILFSSVP